jgi:hypothetical protein
MQGFLSRCGLLRVSVFVCLLCLSLQLAQAQFKEPIGAEAVLRQVPSAVRQSTLVTRHSEQERRKADAALASGNLQTLAHWQGSFSIAGKRYRYTILGGKPDSGGTTEIKTVIVPIRLTISDFSENGKSPLVLDATHFAGQILHSPIFRESNYITGFQQFGDAMLRAEFPLAASDWHTILTPTVGSTMNITVGAGDSQVLRAKSGKLLAVIRDNAIDDPIFAAMQSGMYSPDQYVIFVTYNALEEDAFGYHDAVFNDAKNQEHVFTYSSWLEDVDDLFTIPSPDTTTLSHEVAETIHDAFLAKLSSRTLLWGDPFDHNRCFQSFIEVGDAVEDAPAHIQLHQQVVGSGKTARIYTLQNEALLQWFQRKSPSDALAGAYSFPDIWVLTDPAPLTCK